MDNTAPQATTLIQDRTKQRWIVISIALAAFMAKLDGSIVNISLPAITRHFNTSTSQASWIMLSYLLVQTAAMVITGKLADIIGLRKVSVLGYFIFVLGSLFCAMSPGIEVLIASRCLQGIGSAMMVAAAFAAIPTLLPQSMNGSAFGIGSTSAGLGLIVGAPLGGFITGFSSWHWIFLINIPVGIIAAAVAWKAIPNQGDACRTKIKTFDLTGAFLCFLGLFGLTLGLNQGQEWGWTSFPIISVLLISILLLVGFYFWEKGQIDPVMDLNLFRDGRFLFGSCAGFTAFMIMGGTNFLIPFYLEMVQGLRTEQAGMVLTSFSIVFIFGGFFAGRISDKINPVLLCMMALISMSICFLFYSFSLTLPGLFFSVLFLVWFAVSFSFFMPPNNNQTMQCAPEQARGVASGVFNTITTLGLVFGISVFETILSGLRGIITVTSNGPASPSMIAGFQHVFFFAGFVALLGLLSLFMVKLSYRKRQVQG